MRARLRRRAVSHATWLHRVGEEFGFRPSSTRWACARASEPSGASRATHTAWTTTDLSLPRRLRTRIGDRPVYLSIDIDVLDPAHAPGTGCPEPGGVTFRELAEFLYGLADLHVVALDVMEVSPQVDRSQHHRRGGGQADPRSNAAVRGRRSQPPAAALTCCTISSSAARAAGRGRSRGPRRSSRRPRRA